MASIDDYRPLGGVTNDVFTDAEDPRVITAGHCPACKQRGFIIGPRGGSAINIECANVQCRQRFNVTYDHHQHVVMSQRIERVGKWPSEPGRPL